MIFNQLRLSGPCPPTGISTMQDCLSAIVVVTWQAGSSGSDYYTASMQTDSGMANVCMSDSNECSVPGLMCGHNFTVSVTASNSVCNATAAETANLQSGDTQMITLLTQPIIEDTAITLFVAPLFFTAFSDITSSSYPNYYD